MKRLAKVAREMAIQDKVAVIGFEQVERASEQVLREFNVEM